MKHIFIHCGLHKTGSTSLQTVLSRKADLLLERGVLYPKTGRLLSIGGGHHNIAWEIARDRRFEVHNGKLAALLEEIDNFPGPTILSSEDFETLLGSRAGIDALLAAFAPAHAQVHFMIYLRNQITYCESNFIENLVQNIGEEYRRCTADILRHGRLALKDWSFQFDYRQMLDNLNAAGASVVIRNFHTLEAGSVIADFLKFTGIPVIGFEEDLHLRTNERLSTLVSLRLFFRNRLGRPLGDWEAKAIRMVADAISDRKFVSSDATMNAFRAAFIYGNLKICRQCGLSGRGLDLAMPAHDPSDTITYEQIFSFELQSLISEMRQLLMAGKPDDAAELAGQFVDD